MYPMALLLQVDQRHTKLRVQPGPELGFALPISYSPRKHQESWVLTRTTVFHVRNRKKPSLHFEIPPKQKSAEIPQKSVKNLYEKSLGIIKKNPFRRGGKSSNQLENCFFRPRIGLGRGNGQDCVYRVYKYKYIYSYIYMYIYI